MLYKFWQLRFKNWVNFDERVDQCALKAYEVDVLDDLVFRDLKDRHVLRDLEQDFYARLRVSLHGLLHCGSARALTLLIRGRLL